MASFWNKKTPPVTLILSAIVCISLFIAVSEDSRFGYWPPIVLLAAIAFTIVNNRRIDRLEARKPTDEKN